MASDEFTTIRVRTETYDLITQAKLELQERSAGIMPAWILGDEAITLSRDRVVAAGCKLLLLELGIGVGGNDEEALDE